MTEQTMVERVEYALAFFISHNNQPDMSGDPRARLSTLQRRNLSDAARAAIKAMREPTDAMVKAGVDYALHVTIGGDYKWPDYIRDKHRIMIDAALGE